MPAIQQDYCLSAEAGIHSTGAVAYLLLSAVEPALPELKQYCGTGCELH